MRLSSSWMNLFGYFSEMACLEYRKEYIGEDFFAPGKGFVDSIIHEQRASNTVEWLRNQTSSASREKQMQCAEYVLVNPNNW